jgi:hypothetical protein
VERPTRRRPTRYSQPLVAERCHSIQVCPTQSVLPGLPVHTRKGRSAGVSLTAAVGRDAAGYSQSACSSGYSYMLVQAAKTAIRCEGLLCHQHANAAPANPQHCLGRSRAMSRQYTKSCTRQSHVAM